MCVCMYICMDVRMYVCMYVCMYVRTYVRRSIRHTCACWILFLLASVAMRSCSFLRMMLCTCFTSKATCYIHTYIHICIHTYIHTYTYIPTYLPSSGAIGPSRPSWLGPKLLEPLADDATRLPFLGPLRPRAVGWQPLVFPPTGR